MTSSLSLSYDFLQWNKSQKSAKPKRILNPISPAETSQGQGSKAAADSSRSEKLDDLRVSISGSSKERVCPSLHILVPDYIFELRCLIKSFCSKHGRRKLRKPVQNFMLKLKKVHITPRV